MKLSESKGYEVLMEMRNSLVDEQIILNSKLSKLYSDREELDLYVKALLEDEEIDIKVFTPRNLESKYKDHLAEKSKERAEIEEAIDAALSRRTMVDFKIDQLDIVLSEFRGLCDDGTPEQEEADVSHETLLLSLLENERSRIASDLHDGPVRNSRPRFIKRNSASTTFNRTPCEPDWNWRRSPRLCEIRSRILGRSFII